MSWVLMCDCCGLITKRSTPPVDWDQELDRYGQDSIHYCFDCAEPRAALNREYDRKRRDLEAEYQRKVMELTGERPDG